MAERLVIGHFLWVEDPNVMSPKLDNPQLIPKTDRISVIIAPFDSSGKIRATIIGDVD